MEVTEPLLQLKNIDPGRRTRAAELQTGGSTSLLCASACRDVLFRSIDNTAFGQVVGAELNGNFVTGQDANPVLADSS